MKTSLKIISKNLIFLYIIIFILTINANIYGQNNCSDTVQTSITQDFNFGINDGIRLIRSPSGFSSKDWIIFGSIAGITTGSFFIDKSIRKTVAKNHSTTMDDITKIGHTYGNAGYMIILSGASYLAGKLINNKDISGTSRMVLETLAYAGIITTILKFGIGRARPYAENGPFDFFNFKTNDSYISFPSGHTTTAFAVSSVLAAKINNIYASIALYGLASLTLYQRIYSDQHWFSDTFIGAAISTVIGNAIVKFNECCPKYGESLIILPSLQRNSAGLSLVYNF
jgi:membrane-associated phospholipid phosphatase